MERERRERLIKKREELKARREIESRLRRIENLVQYLNNNRVEYRIHIECEKADKALHSYPAIGSGLNWDKIPNSKKAYYHSFDEIDEIILTVITDYLNKSDTTFVIWGDGYMPILEITANLVAENSGVIADEDSDMWILNLEKGFCLEHRYPRHVAWTISPLQARVEC